MPVTRRRPGSSFSTDNKVEEFDFEAATKRPLKGNIYLAKVTRVEPSLQAAFVEYGGNRQGFLAFSEIHPDYYQIPIADRQALIAEQEAEAAPPLRKTISSRSRSPPAPSRRSATTRKAESKRASAESSEADQAAPGRNAEALPTEDGAEPETPDRSAERRRA